MPDQPALEVETAPAAGQNPPAEALFVSGRQHSGNTVTALVFGQAPECWVATKEDWFFERRRQAERIRGVEARARGVVDLLRLDDEPLLDRTARWLGQWHGEHPEATAVELYREARRFIAASEGKSYWVCKATSYIFYAREILTMLPEARLLYLLRNPYDVSASKKRRDPDRDRLWGWVVSWNRGLRTALRLREEFPGRLLVVRYEDVVTEPEKTFRRIFSFAGVPFRPEYLEVPHVNRADREYDLEGQGRGLNRSRVYAYRGVLEAPEVAAVDALVWRKKLDEYYPDLPHRDERAKPATRLRALGLLAASPFHYAWQQLVQVVRHDSAWRLGRLWRRMRTLVR